MKKKYGGKVTHWQIHHLQLTDLQTKKAKKIYPELIYPPIVFTGTVTKDMGDLNKPSGHMRSSCIVSFDRKTGRVETMNTVYNLDMKTENQDTLPDLGNNVFNIFY